MKIIQAWKVVFLLFFVSSLCQASSKLERRGSELSEDLSRTHIAPSHHSILADRGRSLALDTEESSGEMTSRTSHYDVEEVINAIQRSKMSFYINDHLSVRGDIFKAIKDKNNKVTQLLRTALEKFEKPDGESWSCWPIMSKDKTRIIIHISDPQ
ncbi:MAG: hypothetical protein K2W94_06875 [Alphaproteobacteria bacterium]|nr:hypothetical protein [Alphaproteobacteria bacterium]